MDDAGGIAVPEHLVPALLKWFKNPKPIYGPPIWWPTTYNEERQMKKVHADVRINLGIMPDMDTLTADDVIRMLSVVPLDHLEVEPLHVTFTDIDSGLITSETVFQGKDINKT